MVNLLLSCGRYLDSEILRIEKTSKILQRCLSKTITIPKRVHRGPLDILQALAATVEPEAGVVEYRLQHGDQFTGFSPHFRRIITLSMDSGRRAAKWVVRENPKLFQHKLAEPYIKAFAPPRIISEDTELSEAVLLDFIMDSQVEEAVEYYKRLRENNVDVSEGTKQLLLELTSFYNGKNKPDETLIESKHYDNPGTVNVNTWNKTNFAEELFLEMEENVESYSALILGLMKYNNIQYAMELYGNAEEQNIQFGVDVYNAILGKICHIKFDHPEQEAYILNLLGKMKANNIEPNLGTLNSTLSSVREMKKWIKARHLALRVFNEFYGMGIQPCLATFYYLLEIFSDRNRRGPFFQEILNMIATRSFTPKHPDDFKFFSRAMDVAMYNFQSLPLVNSLHKIFMSGNNRSFLVGNVDMTTYYRSYLAAQFLLGNLDEAVNKFQRCVPQAYVPDAPGTLVILNSLSQRGGGYLLPKMWPFFEDMAMKSNKISSLTLSIITVEVELIEGREKLFDIAKALWQAYNQNVDFLSEPNNLSNLLKVFIICEDKHLIDLAFSKAIELGHECIQLSDEVLRRYIDFCISHNMKEDACKAVEFAVMTRNKITKKQLQKMMSTFELSESEKKFLQNLRSKLENIHEAAEEGEKGLNDPKTGQMNLVEDC